MLRRLPFILLALLAVAMAGISLLPHGEPVYTSLPMLLLWAATWLLSLYYILRSRLWRRRAVFMLHIAFLLILVGAFITHVTGRSESVHLRQGESTAVFGHGIELVEFELVTYPGTQAPCDYRSTVVVDGDTGVVSMNNVLDAASMRLFQSGYDPDRKGTVLIVTRDGAGTAVSYFGYAMLMLSMLVVSLKKFRRFSLMLLSAGVSLVAVAAPQAIPEDVAQSLCSLSVYSKGRIMPMSVFARNFTVAVTGSPTFGGKSAGQFLSGWLFYYESWKSEPCIKVRQASTREALGAGRAAYVPLTAFVDASGRYLADGPEHAEANSRFALVSAAATGSLWKIFPVETERGIEWLSPCDIPPPHIDVAQWHFIRHSLAYLAEQLAKGDADGASATIQKIARYQRRVLGDAAPSPVRVWCEEVFASASDSVVPAVVLLLCSLVMMFFYRRLPALLLAALSVVWLVFLIALNWIASASLPMTNGYETMQWMALASSLLGVALCRRDYITPLCCVVSALAMLVAMMGHRSPEIGVVMPVLRSPLLSVHVLAVMIAYAMFAVMAMCGLAWMCGRRRLLAIARHMIEPAVFFLAAGIFVGAIWANRSWGRYWGWDPKEVWALVTMIVYSFALHGRSLAIFRRDNFYAVYVVLAFLAVVMTYFGVNYVLGGLHSYA